MATVRIPSFDFTGFYYPDILEALIQFKRINVPELSDESPQEPFIQLLRAFALVGHLNNTLADLIANESTLPTAQLVETVRNMLRLIDFEMQSATPAQADLIYEMAQILVSTQEVVPAGALAEASAQGGLPAIPFQALTALSVTRTDEFTVALRENNFIEGASGTLSSSDLGVTVTLSAGTFLASIAAGMKIRLLSGGTGFTNRTATILSRDSDTQLTLVGIGLRSDFTNLDWQIIQEGQFTDETANMNDATGGMEVTPFTGTIALNDALYVGHSEVMWNQMDVTLDTPQGDLTGVWEYYDGETRQTKPDLVTNLGNGQLRFDLNGLLGTSDLKGALVRVQLDETTAFETRDSEWDGSTNFVVVSLLGQTTPSTDADDYTVGSEWHQLTIIEDETQGFSLGGAITYDLPQTIDDDWTETTLNSVEAFYLRWRVTNVGAVPTSQLIDRIQLDQGTQFAKRSVTQGRTHVDDPLGSSDGTANQEFVTSQDFFLDDSETVTVDGITWTSVDNFLSSQPTDRHYIVELGEDDVATIRFGDGVAGQVPPAGVGNVAITYRHNAEIDGNVGANTITSDKAGLRFVNRIFNPRPAAGWKEADGATPESLERVKIEGPASLRVLRSALNGDDAVILAVQFIDDEGARPVARGKGIEEGFGPKTLELVVVGAGGTQLSNTQLGNLDEFFNGDPLQSPPVPKRFVANAEVTSVNFTPISILVTATVTVVKGSSVTAAAIKNQLLATLQPLALREDSALFEWEFGEDVPVTRIIHEIFSTDESILDVDITDLNGGGAPLIGDSVTLATRELPVIDPTSSFTVVES